MVNKRRLPYLRQARDVLLVGWRARGRRRERLAAALGHAVDFRTWESLNRQRLTDPQAVQAMHAFITCWANNHKPPTARVAAREPRVLRILPDGDLGSVESPV